MPAHFFIDLSLRMVFTKATGTCDLSDALSHMTRLLAHPDFDPDFNQLLDYREVTSLPLSHDDVRGLASRKVFSAGSHRAFVAPHDERFGLARMFATYREMEGEPGIHVFRNMPEALAWLKLSAEPYPAAYLKSKSPD